MSWRVVPPVHSALPLGAVFAGIAGALGRDARTALRAALADRVTRGDGSHPQVALTDCGSSALQLAIASACQRSGKRTVALPSWACFDVLSAALGANAEPLFYDLDSTSLLPSAEAVSAVAAAAPAAMVLVYPFGVMPDVAALRRELPTSIALIEDAAQAWGSSFGGTRAGSLGDAAVLSFGRGKGLTGGSGGAWLSGAEAAATGDAGGGWRDVMAMFALGVLTPPLVYGFPARLPFLKLGETQFKPPRPAAGISRAAAAAVYAGLAAGDAASVARAVRANELRQLIAADGWLRNVTLVPTAAPGWLRLPVLATDSATRDALVSEGREFGVAASYPRTLPSLAQELGVPHRVLGDDRAAREIAGCLLTLPTHQRCSSGDRARLERWLRTRATRASAPRR